VHQREGGVEAALHAARQRPAELVPLVHQAESRQQVVRAAPGQSAGQPVHAAHEVELLEAGERVPDEGRLRGDADRPPAASDEDRSDALEDDLAPVRPEKTAQHLQRRGLAGAVRPEQSEDLAPADLEREIVNCGQIAVAFGQADRPEHDVGSAWLVGH
jgi:hypothetical protein